MAAHRLALQELKRERVPLEWAMAQMDLGWALAALGQREVGTGRLEEAVAAYRLALQEYTRERVPLDWALTQTNLGIALAALGQRKVGTKHLEEAVVAWDKCLTVIEFRVACRASSICPAGSRRGAGRDQAAGIQQIIQARVLAAKCTRKVFLRLASVSIFRDGHRVVQRASVSKTLNPISCKRGLQARPVSGRCWTSAMGWDARSPYSR